MSVFGVWYPWLCVSIEYKTNCVCMKCVFIYLLILFYLLISLRSKGCGFMEAQHFKSQHLKLHCRCRLLFLTNGGYFVM